MTECLLAGQTGPLAASSMRLQRSEREDEKVPICKAVRPEVAKRVLELCEGPLAHVTRLPADAAGLICHREATTWQSMRGGPGVLRVQLR